MIKARCECGSVTFASAAEPVLQAICHCADCRSASGSPFLETVFFKKSGCVIEGSLKQKQFISADGNNTVREVCEACGSLMFDRSEGFPNMIGVSANFIEPPFSPSPQCHIWYSSRVSDASDQLTKYDRGIVR